jgi:hypothetical protein
MRTRTVDDKRLVLRILGHPGGSHLAVRDVDRALHVALSECVRPAHIHNDKIRIGRFQAGPLAALEWRKVLQLLIALEFVIKPILVRVCGERYLAINIIIN